MKEEEIRNICTAAAGLYGIIHVRQLSEVLAYVGETNHTRRRLLGLLEESVPANCCLKEGFLYCDHVFERWADWERILERSARKPLCLLPLEELLPYADHEYIEWTPAAEELLSLFEGQGERAWLRQLLEQIALDMRRGKAPQEAMKRLLAADLIVREEDLRRFREKTEVERLLRQERWEDTLQQLRDARIKRARRRQLLLEESLRRRTTAKLKALDNIREALEAYRDRLETARDLTGEALEARMAEVQQLLEQLRDREAVIRARTARRYRQSLRILRGNPSATAKAFSEALESLRKLGDRREDGK